MSTEREEVSALIALMAKCIRGYCWHKRYESEPVPVDVEFHEETRRIDVTVYESRTCAYCTCKDNMKAHGIEDKDKVALPLFTQYGIITCTGCRFHSGRTEPLER